MRTQGLCNGRLDYTPGSTALVARYRGVDYMGSGGTLFDITGPRSETERSPPRVLPWVFFVAIIMGTGVRAAPARFGRFGALFASVYRLSMVGSFGSC